MESVKRVCWIDISRNRSDNSGEDNYQYILFHILKLSPAHLSKVHVVVKQNRLHMKLTLYPNMKTRQRLLGARNLECKLNRSHYLYSF